MKTSAQYIVGPWLSGSVQALRCILSPALKILELFMALWKKIYFGAAALSAVFLAFMLL